jgi:hypothetical protein
MPAEGRPRARPGCDLLTKGAYFQLPRLSLPVASGSRGRGVPVCSDISGATVLSNATPAANRSDHTRVRRRNGCLIALYAATQYESQLGPIADGFCGFTLCVNLKSFEECRSFFEILSEPHEAFWGGGFDWRDP